MLDIWPAIVALMALPSSDFLAYNTRIPFVGTLLLGMCGGGVGSFMLLRKKALVGDVASHAALPGIGLAYLIVESIHPGAGKSMPWLLLGASISAALGIVVTNLIQRTRLIKEDAALGIVLGLFFGSGIVLLTIIQQMKTGSAAGLNDYIFGKTAGMTQSDVYSIAIASAIVLLVCYALFKEFTVLCFDEEYASAVGWPAKRLDLLLTTLVVGVAVIGMQSVGLLLVVALLVIPPSAARFWSNRLGPMVLLASLIGGFSASTGVLLSASVQNLAAGPTIVLAGSLAFLVSLVFGVKRGAFWQEWQRYVTRRKNGQVDLMRACFEEVEKQISPTEEFDAELNQEVPDLTPYSISFASLKSARAWSSGRVSTLIRSALSEGLLRLDSDGNYRITQTGARFAARVVRNHRLWELYLIHFADIAPSRVDRDADLIEHVLEPGLIDQLEVLLKQSRIRKVPISPHS